MYRNYSSDEECSIVDDDDDDTFNRTRGTKRINSNATVAGAKRSCLEVSARNSQSLSGTGRAGHRMGVNFGSDDSSDEDEFDRSIPQRKRKR